MLLTRHNLSKKKALGIQEETADRQAANMSGII
jgi:uncharacterized membrane protein